MNTSKTGGVCVHMCGCVCLCTCECQTMKCGVCTPRVCVCVRSGFSLNPGARTVTMVTIGPRGYQVGTQVSSNELITAFCVSVGGSFTSGQKGTHKKQQ